MSISLQHESHDGLWNGLDNLMGATGRRIASTRQISTRAEQVLDAACLRLDRALVVLAVSRRLAASREADARRARSRGYGRRLRAE